MGRTKTGRGIPRVGGRAGLRITAPLSALALVAAGFAPTADAAAVRPASHTPTAVGAVVTAPAGATRVGAPSDNTVVTVDALLTPRNAAELATYATLVSTPGNRHYKHYLTPSQIATLIAPTAATVQAVDAALRAAGLTPGAASQDNLTIPVTASLGKLKSAFGISFAGYRLKDGRTAFGATSAPKVDGAVAGALSGIVGLNNFAVPTTNVKNKTHGQSVSGSAEGPASISSLYTAPVICSGFRTALGKYLSSSGGAIDARTYYSPAALASAYGTSAELAQGDNGTGVTVAVLEWEAVSTRALATYQSCFGLHNRISYVSTDGGPRVAPTATNGVGIESSLDIEDVAGLAPGSSIIDYQGPDAAGNSSFTDADWLDTIDAAVVQDKAKVLSLSWGECEQQDDTVTRSGETTAFEISALEGQSVFSSSGDYGSTDCQDSNGNPLSTVAVEDPASSSWVTAVGGTYMQGKTLIHVWNDSAVSGGAGGGGVSTTSELAGYGDYQWGFTGKGYSATPCGATNPTNYRKACRQLPDVSAIADWRAGFPQIAYANQTSYTLLVDGGTSLAAPTMAAITALADASHPCGVTGPVGFANPTYYYLARTPSTYARDFNDVTVGNNDYTPSGYTGGDYASTTGFDLASGLGSPKAATLSASLCAL